ncbi:hypothetical protein GCM10009665_49410 [Kitasatospora nipponensis]|uniref:Uncharacterized protein n=1 Tax=Kitasatospora nipponensis TaxID=258049 RepID=A0ABN1WKN4_9ACTN
MTDNLGIADGMSDQGDGMSDRSATSDQSGDQSGDRIADGKGTGGPGVATQIVAAAVLGVIVVAGLWGLRLVGNPQAAAAGKPAVCEKPKDTDAPEYPALCAALNRPDLPTLLGMPTEHVTIATSGGGPMTFADGHKEYDASAEVQLGSVRLRITDNHTMSVKDFAVLSNKPPTPMAVLDHPSAAYTDHTTALYFNAGTNQSRTGTGGVARHLVVAKTPDVDGESFEVAMWREDDGAPDEAALYRIAQAVLPTLQGWVTGP